MDTLIRPATDVRHEMLRIAGKKVETGARLEVRFPWDNRLVGTVPRATPELVAEAFRIAHAYKPKLTRYQRQQILLKTAELLVARKEELSPPDHARIGPLPEGLALRGRPRLRRLHLRRPALPARRRPDLLLRPHPARQAAQDLHPAPAAQRHLGHHALQPSAQHGGAQAGAGLRHQQLRGAEADRADAAHRAVPRRHALRGGPAARDAVGHHRQSVATSAMP